MLYGYARQSRKRRGGESASIEEQTEILKAAGCERFFMERKSGRKERAEFNKMMAEVRPGDVIVVKELSRLGRTALQLIKLFHDFTQKNIHFVAIKQGIDTRTQTGKLMFHLFSVLAENEIDQVEERTDDLVEYARERGRKGGRPAGLSEKARKTADMVRILYQQKQSIADIRKALNIGSNTTVYRYLDDAAARAGDHQGNGLQTC